MPRRLLIVAIPLLLLWLGATFLRPTSSIRKDRTTTIPSQSPPEAEEIAQPKVLPGDILLKEFGAPDTSPIEDLKKLHNILSGYFSVVKDVTLQPIGGNEDLAACLLGGNANRQPFIRPGHPIFNENGLLTDRWGTPFAIHPEAARELTIRSAGPDKTMFSEDDLILLPTGLTP